MCMFISGCDPFKLVRTRLGYHYANFSQVGIFRAVKYKWPFLRNREKHTLWFIYIIIPTRYLSKGLTNSEIRQLATLTRHYDLNNFVTIDVKCGCRSFLRPFLIASRFLYSNHALIMLVNLLDQIIIAWWEF